MLHLQPLAGADEEAAELWCNVWRQLTEVEKRVCYVSEARGLEPCHSPVANSRTACQEKICLLVQAHLAARVKTQRCTPEGFGSVQWKHLLNHILC